ncbi:NAD(P)-dependent malic enzyme [Mycoplasma sp. P36-A1]|uniref:NAD(P)-dependent malic enzyme n=1 Tax=Mycoplasma sp. P36-A1 TaxID=3252900 RepID=UPI003C303A82
MDVYSQSIELHKKLKGKISTETKMPIKTKEELSLLYSPGVAQPCIEIADDESKVYDYTIKGNTIAIISDGSAVLGLGDIKAKASIPVMEGKAALFKSFADVNAFPICVETQDADEIIQIAKNIAPVFGGINLEDIKAPKCFYVEEKLKEMLDIPVFHDDQHGTAIVCLSGLVNALKVVNKKIEDIKVVVNGLGSAGVAIVKLFAVYGVKNFSLCDINGEIFSGELTPDLIDGLVDMIQERKVITDSPKLAEAIKGGDVFIGVSAANIVTKEMAESMNKDAIIFAMANPNPEIKPELAKEAGVAIMATGRSDYPNQINNVLVFPGIFKGALDVRAKAINTEMKIAAVEALSSIISDEELSREYIIPSPFDERVVERISNAVKQAAIDTNVARIK